MTMEPQSPSKSKLSVVGWFKLYRIVKYCLVFVTILIILGVILHGLGILGGVKVYFTVVVDCGSTGTRVNVYQWRTNAVKNGDLPVLLHSFPDELINKHVWNDGCRYHCVQTEPGLDKFVGNYTQVRASLEPLIHWAEGVIPHDRHRDTPIFILATAGLRRVSSEDAKTVLGDVERVVKGHSFTWKREWIRVLSGREEAYFGWVALNYKMGYLRNASRLPTLGLLDLGGSSLQVVVETDVIGDATHVLVSRIGPVEHRLVAYSLPAFGLNQAFDRSVNQAKSLEKAGTFVVRHPCLGLKYVANYSCSSCDGRDSLVHLNGEPDWEKCKMLARGVATNSSISGWRESFRSSCQRNSITEGTNALNLSVGTNPNVRYHALSGFFAVYSMLNLSAKANMAKIREKAEHLCSSTWTDSGNVSNNQQCFKLLYLASLIDDGLCLGNADIVFGPGDISWALGAALVKGDHMWKTSSRFTTLRFVEVISSPVFLFVILSVLLFTVYYSQIKLPMARKRTDVVEASLSSYTQSNERPH